MLISLSSSDLYTPPKNSAIAVFVVLPLQKPVIKQYVKVGTFHCNWQLEGGTTTVNF
jgi:hypothetical protein